MNKPKLTENLERFLEQPIENMSLLSVRARVCLMRAKNKTLWDMIEMTEDQLWQIKGVGRKTIREIWALLDEYGIRLRRKHESRASHQFEEAPRENYY